MHRITEYKTFLKKVSSEKRIVPLIENLGMPKRQFLRYIEGMGIDIVWFNHYSRLTRCFHCFVFLLAFLTATVTDYYSSKANWVIPSMCFFALIVILVYAWLLKWLASNLNSSLIALDWARNNLGFVDDVILALHELDEFLGHEAVIRRKEDPVFIFQVEMEKIVIQARSLCDLSGEIIARRSHNFKELIGSASHLKSLANRLGYDCQTFNEALHTEQAS